MKYRLALACFLLAAAHLSAEPNPKSAPVGEILRAYGLEELLESTRMETGKQAQGAMQSMLTQVQQAAPNLSEAGWKRIRAAADNYLKAAMGGWDSANLTKIYAKVYEENYTLEELTALAAFVKTEGAARSIRVEKLAARALNEAILGEMSKSLQPALQTFMSEIQTIVAAEVKRLQAEAEEKK